MKELVLVQTLTGFSELFERTKNQAILLDPNINNGSDLEYVNDMFTTVQKPHDMELVMSCQCGKLRNNTKLGQVCKNCGTTVQDPMDNNDPIIWLKQLQEHQFINPVFWTIFNELVSKKFDFLLWCSSATYKVDGIDPGETHTALKRLQGLSGGWKGSENFERSYKFLSNNIDRIVKFIVSQPSVRSNKLDKIQFFNKFYKLNRKNLFTSKLPVLSKNLLVVQETPKGKFMPLAVNDLKSDALSFVDGSDQLSEYVSGVKTAILIGSLSKTTQKLKSDLESQHGGFARDSSRGTYPFSGRYVLSPNVHGLHDEIVIPWAYFITVYTPLIKGKLLRRGYKLAEINRLLMDAPNIWTPLMDEICDEILDDSVDDNGRKGLYFIFGRNPSLDQGSILYLRCPTVDRNPKNLVFRISPMIVAYPNADFDGDTGYLIALIDRFMQRAFRTLQPHHNATSVNEVAGMKGISLGKPVTVAMAGLSLDNIPTEESDYTDLPFPVYKE